MTSVFRLFLTTESTEKRKSLRHRKVTENSATGALVGRKGTEALVTLMEDLELERGG
jgi:hypothetical protein